MAITEIERFAYAESSIEKIVIPEGVEKICAFAFAECTNLRDIRLPKSLEDFFLHCTYQYSQPVLYGICECLTLWVSSCS